MPGTTGPSLDDEGMPDLDGPAPGKDETGDPQEGLAPPGEKARASVDWGVTAQEQREGEPISVRVEREVPDVGARDPVDEVAEALHLDHEPLDDF